MQAEMTDLKDHCSRKLKMDEKTYCLDATIKFWVLIMLP